MPDHAQWRARARRRLPRMIFDFIDGAAEDEVTEGWNRDAFDRLAFSPRVLVGNGVRRLGVEVLGQQLSLPVVLAPTGLNRSSHPAGEVAAAKAASAAGTVSVLSGTASASAAEVALAVGAPQWFQTYLYRDPERMAAKLQQARDAGFTTLMITADAAAPGNRERDTRNGMSIPIRVRPRMALDAMRRPRWLANYLFGPPMVQSDLAAPPSFLRRILPGDDPSLEAVVGGMFNPEQTWQQLAALRDAWGGRLVLKGVMNAQDAVRAADAGCDAVVVSNHGGRQLDEVPATIEVLPEVVSAVGDRLEVLLDGGVRRGSDVVKALALGAKAVMIGRPWVLALAADGERGIRELLEGFRVEIDRVMALSGASDAAALDASLLLRRADFGWHPAQDLLQARG